MGLLSLTSRLVGWVGALPPAETFSVGIRKNVKIPMPDGVTLLADHFTPLLDEKRPTILIRSPYGRNGFDLIGRLFAERGFQVVVQSCRGTAGSGGEFAPCCNERDDGLSTISWIERQSWFNGELATFGASYLGLTQWAMGADAGPSLKAMGVHAAPSDLRSIIYPGGALNLEGALQWADSIEDLNCSPLVGLLRGFSVGRRREIAHKHLPLGQADAVLTGESRPCWQAWLVHEDRADEWWASSDFSKSVPRVTAPAHLVGGWYDFFLPQLVRDYGALAAAGGRPYMTIGPWTHTDFGLQAAAIRESVIWFRAHLLSERAALRPLPVRLYVMGSAEWRDYSKWPPSDNRELRLFLHPAGCLASCRSPASAPDVYRYDPDNPTPSLGGAGWGKDAGPRDNRPLEERSDVLVFTSEYLTEDLAAIGPVAAELFVSPGLSHADFFVRLCDVHPSGKSINVCDGLTRVTPGCFTDSTDGVLRVRIDLWPTAYCFLVGHRIRVQISSGAFPRWARNSGTAESVLTGTTLHAAEHRVHHNPQYPSCIVLSVSPEG